MVKRESGQHPIVPDSVIKKPTTENDPKNYVLYDYNDKLAKKMPGKKAKKPEDGDSTIIDGKTMLGQGPEVTPGKPSEENKYAQKITPEAAPKPSETETCAAKPDINTKERRSNRVIYDNDGSVAKEIQENLKKRRRLKKDIAQAENLKKLEKLITENLNNGIYLHKNGEPYAQKKLRNMILVIENIATAIDSFKITGLFGRRLKDKRTELSKLQAALEPIAANKDLEIGDVEQVSTDIKIKLNGIDKDITHAMCVLTNHDMKIRTSAARLLAEKIKTRLE